MWQCTIIWWKGGYTQDLTETDIERLPHGPSRKEQDEEPYAELCILAKNGPGHFQYGWCLQGLCPGNKGATDYLQAVAKDRPTLVQDSCEPIEDVYYLIVVDSYTTWPEILRCKRSTTGVTITFLHKLFARFGVVDCLVGNNGTQFTSSDFKEFCDTFQIKHITTPPYHPRSNGLEECFIDTLKRALKKASGTPSEKALQQFLQVYRIAPNLNIPDTTSPAETMFARKIRLVFEKLLPKQASLGRTTTVPTKRYNPGDKVFFKAYSNNTSFWELGTINKRIGNKTYIILGLTATHKRRLNQIRRWRLDDPSRTLQDEEEAIKMLYDTFDIKPPQAARE